MCNITPEPSIGEGDDSSIHVAVSSTYTEQQNAPRTVSVRSAGASRVPTPDPTPSRPGTRSLTAMRRAQELERQQRQPQPSPSPTKPPFDASFVVDLVPRPELTSPVPHGTKRVRSIEEIMNEIRTPAKDKMSEAIEHLESLERSTKKLRASDQAAGNGESGYSETREFPIRSSPKVGSPSAGKTSQGGGVNNGSRAPSQKDGSQDSQSSQPSLGKR